MPTTSTRRSLLATATRVRLALPILCLAFVSCSQDEGTSADGGTPPSGAAPLAPDAPAGRSTCAPCGGAVLDSTRCARGETCVGAPLSSQPGSLWAGVCRAFATDGRGGKEALPCAASTTGERARGGHSSR